MAECVDIVRIKEGRVCKALPIVDSIVVLPVTPWTEVVHSFLISSQVGHQSFVSHVRIGAGDSCALILVWEVAIVKASQPQGTGVSSKGPLANPDVVLDFSEILIGIDVVLTVEVKTSLAYVGVVSLGTAGSIVASVVPSLVEMMVHYYIFHVIVVKHVVPGICSTME